MNELSTFRLYLLRAMYLLMAVGLVADIWPLMLRSAGQVEHMRGVVWSILTAVSLLAMLGLRYPVKMLPLLFFELTWKVIWVGMIGLPRWMEHRLDPGTAGSLRDCLLGVVLVPLVIPWGYVFRHYVKAPGDRWKTAKPATMAEHAPARPAATASLP